MLIADFHLQVCPFFKALPQKDPVKEFKVCNKSKKLKVILTVIFSVQLLNHTFVKSVAVWKNKLRRFSKRLQDKDGLRNAHYCANQKAWMTTKLSLTSLGFFDINSLGPPKESYSPDIIT